MEFKKRDIQEIIDSNNDLIGNNAVPTTGSDLESQAKNTTDYNMQIGTQPYRYDMMARFGFNLLPFYEGKEDQSQLELLNDLSELVYNKYRETLEYYFRHPNKLKSDFRIHSEKSFDKRPNKNIDIDWAKKIVKIFEKHFDKFFINEDKLTVVEDKFVDKKKDNEISKKSNDNSIGDKNIKQIADLINKLDKTDINKIKGMLD